MAVEAQMKDDQEQDKGFGQQNQQDTVPTLGGQQSSILGQSAAPTNQQAQSQVGQSTTQQKGSGMGARLTNLKKYIDTNRGISTADKIKTNLETSQQNLIGNIQQEQKDFERLNSLTEEKDRLSRGENLIKASDVGGKGLFEQGKTESFTGIQQNPNLNFDEYGQTEQERLAEFNKLKEGQRQQFEIQNLQKLQQQQRELEEKARMTQSESGRYQLLRDMFKRPSYTTGQQKLDQLLLQAQPEESGKLLATSQVLANPITEEMTKLTDLRDRENEALRNQASRIAADIETGLSGTRETFESDIQNRLLEKQKDVDTKYNDLTTAFESGAKLTKEQLKDYTGIQDDKELDNLTNVYNQTSGRTFIDKLLSGNIINPEDVQSEIDARNIERSYQMAKYRDPEVSTQDYANKLNQMTPREKLTYLSSLYRVTNDPNLTYANARDKYAEQFNEQIPLTSTPFISTRQMTVSDISTAEDYARQQALDLLQNRHSNLVQAPVEQTPYNTVDINKLANLTGKYTNEDMKKTIEGLDDSYISQPELDFRNWLRDYFANR